MRFREDIMINTSQMESIMRKLPQSLKEHVSLIIYQVGAGVLYVPPRPGKLGKPCRHCTQG
jgi:hypothetical protein